MIIIIKHYLFLMLIQLLAHSHQNPLTPQLVLNTLHATQLRRLVTKFRLGGLADIQRVLQVCAQAKIFPNCQTPQSKKCITILVFGTTSDDE